MINYLLNQPHGWNTMCLQLTAEGARDVLRCASIRRTERARGVRRYFTSAGVLCVWATRTDAHKRYVRGEDGIGRQVWVG